MLVSFLEQGFSDENLISTIFRDRRAVYGVLVDSFNLMPFAVFSFVVCCDLSVVFPVKSEAPVMRSSYRLLLGHWKSKVCRLPHARNEVVPFRISATGFTLLPCLYIFGQIHISLSFLQFCAFHLESYLTCDKCLQAICRTGETNERSNCMFGNSGIVGVACHGFCSGPSWGSLPTRNHLWMCAGTFGF